MKRVGFKRMLVTKPGGEAIVREIRLTYDDQSGGSFEVEITGESPLKGYSFVVKQGDLKSVRDTGTTIA